MKRQDIGKQNVLKWRRWFRGMGLMVLILCGWSGAMGQTYETGTLEEGFFYIVHNQDRTYSLCPAEDPANPNIGKWYDTNHTMPFLTTKKTSLPDDYRLWHLTKDGSGNFQMIHAKDNKYVINDTTGKAPEAVHLDVLPENGTNTWYVINYVSNGGYYNIKSISVTNNYSINPYNGNKDNYDGNGGGIHRLLGQRRQRLQMAVRQSVTHHYK